MNVINDGVDALRARACLIAALGNSSWLLTTNVLHATSLDSSQFEVRVEWGKLFFSWWNDESTQVWRVTGFEVSSGIVRLLARSGPARAPILLTLWQPEVDVGKMRLVYLDLLKRLLTRRLHGYGGQYVISAAIGPNRHRHLRKGYARIVLDRDGATVLALGASAHDPQEHIDGVVEAGIIWASRFNQNRPVDRRAHELMILLPRNRSRTALDRLTLISTEHLGVRIRCLEVDENLGDIVPVSIASQMELFNARPRRLMWPAQPPHEFGESSLRSRMIALAPETIEIRPSINGRGERFLINGLEFARRRLLSRPDISFGINGGQRLTSRNFAVLQILVADLLRFRRADSPDRQSALYRLRAEAWLESIICRDIRRFDPTLDDRYVYSQIPTWRGDERSVLDMLAVTRAGRLVVIEIKASADSGLPLQGLDYWLRVEEARRQRQFESRGLFRGISISEQPPLLYLVTPHLRFHRTFAEIARCLAPEVDAYRIGINANWRAQLRVICRERVNTDQKED